MNDRKTTMIEECLKHQVAKAQKDIEDAHKSICSTSVNHLVHIVHQARIIVAAYDRRMSASASLNEIETAFAQAKNGITT